MSSAPDSASTWHPLLEGGDADHVHEAIAAIATDLAGCPPLEDGDPSVGVGSAGVALFFAYLARSGFGEKYGDLALQWLDTAVEGVSSQDLPLSLFHGLTGVAWTVEHLQGSLLDPESGDPNEEVDEVIQEFLVHSPGAADYELISGLIGLGLYARERLPRPVADDSMARIIRHLDETAERTPEGIAWWTPPERLWPHFRAVAPNGLYNLGVAHGIAGVLSLLATAQTLGVEADRSRRLLDGGVDWLLSRRLSGSDGFLFPDFQGPGILSRGSRLAWCYGDPGIAAVLLHASHCAGREDWRREALEIARNAASLPREIAQVADAGLCHGAVGLAHLYNRMQQTTGDPLLRDKAVFWYQEALELRRPGEWIGGFFAWEAPGTTDQYRRVSNPAFLTGAAGIGLGLLAAVTPLEPAWDRLLLLS